MRRGVIGILGRGDELLLIQRAMGVAKGGTWCFPGGHVETDETSRIAIIREFSEELGIRVEPYRRMGAVRVPDSRHILAIWRVELLGGTLTPDPREIADVRWLTPSQVRAAQPALPSNEEVLRLLGL